MNTRDFWKHEKDSQVAKKTRSQNDVRKSNDRGSRVCFIIFTLTCYRDPWAREDYCRHSWSKPRRSRLRGRWPNPGRSSYRFYVQFRVFAVNRANARARERERELDEKSSEPSFSLLLVSSETGRRLRRYNRVWKLAIGYICVRTRACLPITRRSANGHSPRLATNYAHRAHYVNFGRESHLLHCMCVRAARYQVRSGKNAQDKKCRNPGRCL